MRAVRAGKEVLVTDRDVLVARLVPVEAGPPGETAPVGWPRDPTAPPLGRVQVRGIAGRGTDTTALLLEDRGRR